MILPMVKYLESYGVQFHFGVKVTNVEFDCNKQRKLATRIDTLRDGKEEHIDLTENDLVFITNGGAWRIPLSVTRTRRLSSIPKSARAAAGICGAKLPRRTPLSVTRISSAAILSRRTG